ncbi:putative oligosaccharyl transferase subunit [Leishmania major strain Friedlin]|uniref:dolichyl-diphosphooligosaccharide--protein glycotransferase n=1 Tax=Leishmania major TaxID=5664 RepID=E9AET9_LEIMA|nr:putative oligosaccharyl transferase subunit [Leishmania major strain Friedlin]CAG9582467.1 oligosaccharyl_transferase_subunit [Leishmania major strain Friedlin]CBZ12743.1 putative oligosaccharyl transferase subunit [Leishmania major strain Friedlin]|eukprot:XP_003722509.1 putative oligosaccharyl transferase subunit [Leishmania major strain Friedlin]
MGKRKGNSLGDSGSAATASREASAQAEDAASQTKTASPPAKVILLPKTLTDEKDFIGIFPFPFWPVHFVLTVVALFVLAASCFQAFTVRMISVQIYGYLIHEFDPWFNYRAAEYMSTHGWSAFFSWFDYMSWYPLGRPVGSTTYPGLQLTAVAIHRALAAAGMPMSLNNVCVLMPAWFGAIATATLAFCTYEASGSTVAAAAAALSFSIIPAHLMRSMAGEFDNECIAVAAMLLTFYCWVRSLRTRSSWPIGVLTGVAYGYMAAAWGGYIFVLNMVAMHAGISSMVDWARNTYNPSLLRAYTLFYVVGTAIAVCVPPVGMSPFKSLEQLGALLVLVFLCGLQVCEVLRARAGVEVRSRANFKIRVRVFSVMAGVAALAISVLAPTGYFGPLSVRVRALFVEHTRTGNPLVDSVAEHQPASPEAMWAFLHVCGVTWGLGSIVLAVSTFVHYSPSKVFWLLNSGAVYYFSTRMARLLLLSGPAACLSTGIFVGTILEAAVQLSFWDSDATKAKKQQKQAQRHQRGAGKGSGRDDAKNATTARAFCDVFAGSSLAWGHRMVLSIAMWALVTTTAVSFFSSEFASHSTKFAEQSSNPMIVFAAVVQNRATGKPMNLLVDDYLKAYEWLRDSTPEDARVLAWWDYGYQITGIGNRTSLADGNTWNHEHIATIGKMLTSPVVEAHSLVRHMADYVLIWAGQSGDLMKSPHMARIGNSVYHDICPDDPLCQQFGFHRNDYSRPTPMMRASLLYNLHEAGKRKGVKVNPSLFQEVYSSKYGLVRIFKVMNVSAESKKWVADPANRVCHPPGSWICPGQYPPAKEIQEMLAHRVPFDQVTNADRKNNVGSYQEEYMRRMRESENRR